MKEKTALFLIKKTQKDYNKIAESFSATRTLPWPIFEVFKNYVKDNDKVLDIGCGNGRILESLKDKKISYLGIDSSEKLIQIAKQRYGVLDKRQFKKGDFLEFESQEKYDVIFMIAFLHHIPSKKLRQKTLQKAFKMLKKEGFLIISVWNLWKKDYLKYIFKGIFEKIFLKKDWDFFDAFVPWQGKIQRYYHAFFFSELKKTLFENGFLVAEKGKTKGRKSNFYFICQKK